MQKLMLTPPAFIAIHMLLLACLFFIQYNSIQVHKLFFKYLYLFVGIVKVRYMINYNINNINIAYAKHIVSVIA